MRSFFKMFFASLLSIVVFSVLCVFILISLAISLTTKSKPHIADGSVLVINLSQTFREQRQQDAFAELAGADEVPGLYDVVRLLDHAATDDRVSGVILESDGNGNGFAASNELRQAIIDFRRSKKFVIARADRMSQEAYFVAAAADRIYINPSGDFSWSGYSVAFIFVKEMLDKLDIEPQIFYAGKFKSATEMFRTSQMTPENKLQTSEWLNDLYSHFLEQTAKLRNIDSATLRRLADTAAIQTPHDAVRHKLIDGVKYDDEIKTELKQRLKLGREDKLQLVSINKYSEAVNVRKTGRNRIALIYAEGNIVDGKGATDNIGGDRFQKIIRKARLDKSVKALVLRVNSGGGSALASEIIWRELDMAKKDGKPVIVSFGDVAASGGYYIACGADSIFASANTITGSIGVFGIVPNMGPFFKNKLGITFDGVKTGPYADAGAFYRPLSEAEKQMVQKGVDRIYSQFRQRVAEGRKKSIAYVDSIAQGRVWSGSDAIRLGLVDRTGSLEDAIRSAARMSKLDDYGVKEYPEQMNWLDEILNRQSDEPAALIRARLGEEQYRIFMEMSRIKEMTQSVQARLPFEIIYR